jgi:hypothetical protein
VNEGGFSAEALSLNGSKKRITGRNINEKALLVISTLRDAYCFYNQFVSTNGSNPSGTKLEDMLLHVRQQCWLKFKGKKNMALARRQKTTGSEEPLKVEDMPAKYFFTGYFAWVLFGPQGISGESLSCISPDGDSVPKKGRAQARKDDLEVRNKERETAADGYIPEQYHRGVNLKDKVSAAQIAHFQAREANQNVRELLHICNEDHKNVLAELGMVTKMIERGEENGNDTSSLVDRMNELFESLSEIKERKKKLNKESERLMDETSAKRQVDALMEQVGNFSNKKQRSLSSLSMEEVVTEEVVTDNSSVVVSEMSSATTTPARARNTN